MYPFIHIGHFSIGTFGLCLWLASVCACWTLYKNFQRNGIDADAVGVAAYTTVGGVVGAKLWHVLEDPTLLMHQPLQVLFDRAGFAWFGGLLVGIAVLVWQGRQAPGPHGKLGGLAMLDLAAPAVAIGYGVGRLGCLISGDGDYGIPTNLPWGMSFPNGLVPTIDDDGFVVWESNAIVRYLAAKHAPGKLWPTDVRARADADRWMDWTNSTLWPTMLPLFRGFMRAPVHQRDSGAIEVARQESLEVLQILDAQLATSDFVGGKTFTMGDIAVGCAVWRWMALPIERPALVHVQRWFDTLATRAAYCKVVMQPLI